MAFTLLAAQGVSVGSTQIEAHWLEVGVCLRACTGKHVTPNPLFSLQDTSSTPCSPLAVSTKMEGWLPQHELPVAAPIARLPPARQLCRRTMARAAARGCRLLLPTDVLWSSSLDGDQDTGLQVLTPSCCTQERPCIPPGGLPLRLRVIQAGVSVRRPNQVPSAQWYGMPLTGVARSRPPTFNCEERREHLDSQPVRPRASIMGEHACLYSCGRPALLY